MKCLKKMMVGSMALSLAAGSVVIAQQQPNQPNTGNQRTTQTPGMANRNTMPGDTRITFVAIGTVVPVRLPAWPAGFVQKDLREAEGIHDVFASTTEAALTEDGFDDLVERLVDQDRNRIGMNDFTDKKFTELNGRAGQLRKAFRDKYGVDFDIEDESRVFNDRYTLVQGEVSDPQVIAAHWPLPATRSMMDSARANTNVNEPAARPAAGDLPGNVLREDPIEKMNLEKGRNVAIAGFPELGNIPELHVSLIHELPDSWRLDIPNSISGQQLHDSLLKNLTYLGENTAQWPANVDDARRLVAHYVIAAIYNVHPQQLGARQNPTP